MLKMVSAVIVTSQQQLQLHPQESWHSLHPQIFVPTVICCVKLVALVSKVVMMGDAFSFSLKNILFK